jgi:hypothetical protein
MLKHGVPDFVVHTGDLLRQAAFFPALGTCDSM